MRTSPARLSSRLLLLLLLIGWRVAAQEQGSNAATKDDDADGEKATELPKMTLDPAAVRDAIASLLREGVAGDSDDGYAEAAQEYLEYVQSLLSAVKTASEVYIREQLADLETLHGLLVGLESAGRLTPSASARLVSHLAKGPARELIIPAQHGLEPATSFAFPAVYAGSELAARVTDAVDELRRFLATVSGASLTEELRRHAEAMPAGGTRDYLDSVLDRVLELEVKEARFTVEIPGEEVGGEPQVTRVTDDDGQSTSSASDADGGDGRSLFDQVLGRRAAAAVAAQLAEGGPAAAAARIEELRGRRYQPAGMAVILEAIEQCLKQGQ